MSVDPSSAPRSCTLVYLTSSRPQLGHRSCAVLPVCSLCFSTRCTVDCNFCRRAEGKSEGFDFVTITFDPVSIGKQESHPSAIAWREQENLRFLCLSQTFVPGTAAFTVQRILFCAFCGRKQIAAIGAEDERSNRSHFHVFVGGVLQYRSKVVDFELPRRM